MKGVFVVNYQAMGIGKLINEIEPAINAHNCYGSSQGIAKLSANTGYSYALYS